MGELGPARPRLADRHGERLALGDPSSRFDRDPLSGLHRVAAAERSIDVVEPGIRPGGAVGVLERVGVEPCQCSEHDADAEQNDDPTEGAW